jgi:hypothetical protein
MAGPPPRQVSKTRSGRRRMKFVPKLGTPRVLFLSDYPGAANGRPVLADDNLGSLVDASLPPCTPPTDPIDTGVLATRPVTRRCVRYSAPQPSHPLTVLYIV